MQYFCKNKERRLRVFQNDKINGIDFVEVDPTDQKILEIHFVHPLPDETGGLPDGTWTGHLDTSNIVVEGGVRIKNIEVVNLSVSGQVMTVNVNGSGDFSIYTLRLVNSPTDLATPQGFDPQLSSIDFSFKANCPSDFDCRTNDVCLEEGISNPRINYLAKDYASFRLLALDRLSLLIPDWQERSAADLQIAMVELLAYTGDYLSYYQDAVATEAYLFKARKRISSRRHARLLDYHVHNGCNSRSWIYLEVASGGSSDGAVLNKGNMLFTKGTDSKVINDAQRVNVLRESEVQVFETMYDHKLFSVHNEIDFYTWDDSACCLQKGATSATLWREDQAPIHLAQGDVLIFEEVIGPKSGHTSNADPGHRHAVRITDIERSKDVLYPVQPDTGETGHNTGETGGEPDYRIVYEIKWHEADALPFPLCISAKIDGRLVSKISVARGNIILADHGRTVVVDKLVPGTASAEGNFRPKLPDQGVTVSVPYQYEEYLTEPASDMLIQDPHEAIADIMLSEGDEIWNVQRDLLASDRFAQEFVAEIESDQSVQLRFGDDILGKKPGEGFSPGARYRIGNGPSGNVGAEAIDRIHWNFDGIVQVRNPIAAQGGRRAETIEEVKQYAPESFKIQERAVTEADYVVKTELHPQVQKALAKFRWTGSWHTVFLTIDRTNSLSIDDEFKNEIHSHLEKYRLAGYDLEIRPPQFVALEIEMNICVRPGYFKSAVKRKLEDLFSRFDLPDGTRGFFHPDLYTFGQPVYLSAIYEKAMRVDGVESVELKTFKPLLRAADLEKENGVLEPRESEIIRLDNDPNFPENGKINFLMFGGL